MVRRIERGEISFGTDKECVGRIRAKKDEKGINKTKNG